MDGKAVARRARATTGPDGLGVLEFDLPAGLDSHRLDVQIEARRHGLVRQMTSSLWLNRRSGQILITTDKPLYQPGQTLHMRILAISPSGIAWPGGDFGVTVKDPEGRQVFRELLATNRLGVASADWSIPESTRQGHFSIYAQSNASESAQAYGWKNVEIRSYQLPAFMVEVLPNRSFYLPGQDVKLQVKALHLSGKPLPSGQLRIVREQKRRLLYGRQQGELEEDVVSQGELDARGAFEARLDLGETKPFAEVTEYRRYKDQAFTAYLTDPMTGRTEQRRFKLRFSPDPIHIYLTQSLPMAGERLSYVTTFYADGRPAQCRVQVRMPSDSSQTKPLAEAQTNRYGVARLAMRLPLTSESYIGVQLTAHDQEGQTASWREQIWQGNPVELRLQTDRTIYRAGQDLRIEIISNPAISTAFVDVYKSGKLLLSRRSVLQGGRASLRIPYRREFSGLLSINAFSPATSAHRSDRRFSVIGQVVYPRSGLEVVARTEAVYRPGQKARAEFRVTQQGRPVQSALGVVIADRGIQERLRSDLEYRNWGSYNAFGPLASDPLRTLERFGIPYRQLDLSEPIPADIQLAARAAFEVGYHYGHRQFSAVGPKLDYRDVFDDWFSRQSDRLGEAVRQGSELYQDSSLPNPGLDDLLSASGLTLADLPDPWGNPYQPECGPGFGRASLALRSSGPDERPASRDDFVALQVHWPYYQEIGQAIRKAALNVQSRTLRPLQDERALKEEMVRLGIDLNALRDPCGAPLRPAIGFEKQLGVVSLTSAGADRQFDTPDDYRAARQIWHYFKPLNQVLNGAVAEHHERTGSLLWDAGSLRREFLLQGIDLDALRDPWRHPYLLQAKIENHLHGLSLASGGANGRFDSVDEAGRSDDFMIWKAATDYFPDQRRMVLAALDSYQQRSGKTPASLEELTAALSESGLDLSELRDPWNRPLRLVWGKLERTFDSLCISQYAVYGQSPQERIYPGKLTRQSALAAFRSAGRDGVPGTEDDFDAVRLTLLREEIKTSQPTSPKRIFRWLELPSSTASGGPEGSGLISGKVTDAMGAVIPGAEITAIHNTLRLTRTVISGDTGCYFMGRLPAGLYSLRFHLAGFRQLEIVDVPVAESVQTPLDARLEVGEISETITVSSGAEPVHTQPATIRVAARAGASEQVATPRLRQYFPETLVGAFAGNRSPGPRRAGFQPGRQHHKLGSVGAGFDRRRENPGRPYQLPVFSALFCPTGSAADSDRRR